MGFFTYVAKYYLFFTNLLFVITGGSFILYGGLMVNWFYNYTRYFQKNYDYIPAIIVTIGVIMLLISIFGLVASLKSDYHLITVYAIIFFVVFLIQVVGVALYFGYMKQIYDYIGRKVERAFKDYERDIDITLFYNRIQSTLHCCGIKGVDDFRNRMVPTSCCSLHKKGKCVKNTYFKRGCKEAVKKIPEEHGNIVYIVIGVIIGMQFVGLLSAFFLIYAFRNDFKTV